MAVLKTWVYNQLPLRCSSGHYSHSAVMWLQSRCFGAVPHPLSASLDLCFGCAEPPKPSLSSYCTRPPPASTTPPAAPLRSLPGAPVTSYLTTYTFWNYATTMIAIIKQCSHIMLHFKLHHVVPIIISVLIAQGLPVNHKLVNILFHFFLFVLHLSLV